MEIEPTLELLESDRHSGLNSEQVQQRRQHFGSIEIEEASGRTNWQILLDQFTNIMLLMLIGVAVVSGILDFMDLRSGKLEAGAIPFKDTIAILSIVILNGVLGYLQESRAEKALAALKRLASPKVRTLREGKLLEIAAKELVPGDIIQLEAGVQIAADGRLLEEANLQIRESALTGEAQAVNKHANLQLPEETALGDRLNLVFQGTEVVQGRGTVIVTATGMQTELGKIASMLQGVESEPTPLQKRMGQLSNVLVSGSLLLVAIVIAAGTIHDRNFGRLKELVEVSLSMAVAIVPEGLPAVITVTLALGTQRMVRRHALIRKLPAVETLGSVTTICSDKTGTLTQNKMVVQAVATESDLFQVSGIGYSPIGDFQISQSGENQLSATISVPDYPELKAILAASLFCNDSFLQSEQDEWLILGDPTEGALLSLAAKGGFYKDQITQKLPRVKEFPFSSERKRMSVVCENQGLAEGELIPGSSPFILFSKGSPELILERCTQGLKDNVWQPLTPEQRDRILSQNDDMASRGLRVLGIACKLLPAMPPGSDAETEQELVWLGLVGMMDAARPEVYEAVKRCKEAGIRVVMITGDHKLTAKAIAIELGIANEGDRVLSGQELAKISQEELEQQVDQISLYARVAPEHKLRIVQALQNRGRLVAMTGDGVNDAPALKQADIGIAMGITGTDVSKEASDMVLLDDNFATIVAATEEGRVVYTNIRRFIKYILGSNIGELLTIAAAPLIGLGGVPLSPLQILWMNLVTDGLPALALAVEPAEPNVMQRPPHHPQESIFARGLGLYMVRIGLIFAITTIALMWWAYTRTHAPGYPGNPNAWKTMVFTTLCIAQMGHAIAIRSNTQLTIELNPLSNPYLLLAVTVTTVLQLMLVYVPPLQNFFGTHPLSMTELGVCLAFSSLMFIWVELEKIFFRWYNSRSRK